MALDLVRPNSTRHYRVPGITFSLSSGAFAFWARLNVTDTGYQYILSNGQYSTSGAVNVYTDDAAKIWRLNVGTSAVSGTGTLSNGEEVLVVINADAGDVSLITCQANATAVNRASISTAGGNATAGTTWYYGCRADVSTTRFTQGDLGPLMHFTRPLTMAEIESLAAGTQPADLPGGGPANHWRFQSPDAVVLDEVGTADATQYGTGWATAAAFPGENTSSPTDSVSPLSLTLPAPVLDTPTLSRVVTAASTSILLGVPDLGQPTVSEVSATTLLPSSLITAAPALGQPALGQSHKLSTGGILVTAPVVGSPSLAQSHKLTAAAVNAGAPVLGSPSISGNHQLTLNSLLAGLPLLGHPVLDGASGVARPEHRITLAAEVREVTLAAETYLVTAAAETKTLTAAQE